MFIFNLNSFFLRRFFIFNRVSMCGYVHLRAGPAEVRQQIFVVLYLQVVGCWQPHLGPLQEQCVHLTTKHLSSLKHQFFIADRQGIAACTLQ